MTAQAYWLNTHFSSFFSYCNWYILNEKHCLRKTDVTCMIECVLHLASSQIQPAFDQISDHDFCIQHFRRIGEPADSSQVITVRCARNNCHRCSWIQRGENAHSVPWINGAVCDKHSRYIWLQWTVQSIFAWDIVVHSGVCKTGIEIKCKKFETENFNEPIRDSVLLTHLRMQHCTFSRTNQPGN